MHGYGVFTKILAEHLRNFYEDFTKILAEHLRRFYEFFTNFLRKLPPKIELGNMKYFILNCGSLAGGGAVKGWGFDPKTSHPCKG